jgi:hypothetical protein
VFASLHTLSKNRNGTDVRWTVARVVLEFLQVGSHSGHIIESQQCCSCQQHLLTAPFDHPHWCNGTVDAAGCPPVLPDLLHRCFSSSSTQDFNGRLTPSFGEYACCMQQDFGTLPPQQLPAGTTYLSDIVSTRLRHVHRVHQHLLLCCSFACCRIWKASLTAAKKKCRR